MNSQRTVNNQLISLEQLSGALEPTNGKLISSKDTTQCLCFFLNDNVISKTSRDISDGELCNNN